MARGHSEPGYRRQEARLGLQLDALRSLPPGTGVSVPPGHGYSRLWRSLRALPPGPDPLQQTVAEDRKWLARLALYRCLRTAEQLLQLSRTVPHGSAAPNLEAPGLGSLLERGRELQPWAAPSDSLEDALARLNQLAGAANLPDTPSPRAALHVPGTRALLMDLLSLPRDVDPLHWLEAERSELCAVLVWSDMVDRIGPSPEQILASGTVLPPRPVRGSIPCGRALRATPVELRLLRLGFALHLASRLFPPQGPSRAGSGMKIIPRWEGFDRVDDESGRAYLVRSVQRRASSRRRGWREDVTLVCYPPLAGAQELVWRSRPAMLALDSVSGDSEETVSVQVLVLGNIEWRMLVEGELR